LSKSKTLPWYVDAPPIRRWVREMEADGHGAEAWTKVESWRRMVDESGVVKTSRQGRIGTITLSYPLKGNALVPPMYRMLERAILEMAEDDDIWVVIITGEGKNFSSGGYVGPDGFYAGLDAGKTQRAEPMRRTFVELFLAAQRLLFEFEKPTIAYVNGPVMGEANDIALAADIRTGHAESDFWFSFGYSGNTAYTGCAWALPRIVGLARAKQLLLTASRITGKEAYELGLLSYLYEKSDGMLKTMELAERIASLPPVSLRLIKKEIHRSLEIGSYVSSLDVTSMIEPIVQFTHDHVNAEEAIIAKRAPVVLGY
jgi:2-(1,2-epoxy-1,2-dihydrophenyl)acetyl-CoA isomerase